MSEVCVIYSTAPDADTAARIARTLVDERLAACGNLVPGVRSIYRWQGAVQDEAEVVLILKTRAEQVEALTRRLVELHPYEVPDVVALPVTSGHGPYLDWVRQNSGG